MGDTLGPNNMPGNMPAGAQGRLATASISVHLNSQVLHTCMQATWYSSITVQDDTMQRHCKCFC